MSTTALSTAKSIIIICTFSQVALSVGVQKMVRSDKAASGVMFTVDTESGHPDMVFITGAWGLGENVVQVLKWMGWGARNVRGCVRCVGGKRL